MDKAAALSYYTLISFVPLSTAFVSIYVVFFPYSVQQLQLLMAEFLPYENETWVTVIDDFIRQTQSLGGFSLIVFFLIALRVLMIIEAHINRIWGVDRVRSLGSRISSFTLLLFWGPILLGLAGSLFLLLNKQPSTPAVVLFLGPKAMTLLTFTMLFWTVPYTKVRLDSALFGSIATTLLIVVGKAGFLAYLRAFKVFSGILGSLGLVLLFFITINLMWAFVLSGTLVAFTHQNYQALKAEYRRHEIPQDRFLVFWALALLIHVARTFSGRNEPPTVANLAEDFQVPLDRLQHVTDALSESGLIAEGDKEGHLLFTRSPETITVGDVFRSFHADSLSVPDGDEIPMRDVLTPYLTRFDQVLSGDPWSATIQDIARLEDSHGSQ